MSAADPDISAAAATAPAVTDDAAMWRELTAAQASVTYHRKAMDAAAMRRREAVYQARRAGISQSAISRAIGVAVGQVSQLEKMRNPPDANWREHRPSPASAGRGIRASAPGVVIPFPAIQAANGVPEPDTEPEV